MELYKKGASRSSTNHVSLLKSCYVWRFDLFFPRRRIVGENISFHDLTVRTYSLINFNCLPLLNKNIYISRFGFHFNLSCFNLELQYYQHYSYTRSINQPVFQLTSWKQNGIAKTLTPIMQLIRLNTTGLVLMLKSSVQSKIKQNQCKIDVIRQLTFISSDVGKPRTQFGQAAMLGICFLQGAQRRNCNNQNEAA